MKKTSVVLIVFFSLVMNYSCNHDDNPALPVNHPPNAPYNPSPQDGAINISRWITLAWSCTDPDAGDTLRYDIISRSTHNPWQTVVTDYPDTVYHWGLAEDSLQIFWQVTAKDNHNQFTRGPIWSFTTGHH
jgi:TolB protein